MGPDDISCSLPWAFQSNRLILCSRRLPEEPNQPRLGPHRRQQSAHADSRRGEARVPRKVDSRAGLDAAERPRTARPSPPEDPPARLPRAMAELHRYHPPAAGGQRCELRLRGPAVSVSDLPGVQVQGWGEERGIRQDRGAFVPAASEHRDEARG